MNDESNLVYLDLLYFGYEPDSKRLQDEFISEVVVGLSDTVWQDAYD